MSVRELARKLGLGASQTSQLLRRGMPRDPEAAREWRARCVRPRARPVRATAPPSLVASATSTFWPGALIELGGEELEDTIPRLRRLEKNLAVAAERAFREGRTPEAISLRREHVTAIKALYDAESKLIKINEARGRLISVDRAFAMINEAMQSAILVLRRLPEMGRDPDERRRLEAFMNGVLVEIRRSTRTIL